LPFKCNLQRYITGGAPVEMMDIFPGREVGKYS
jgi:hypothetical protein